MGSMDMITHLIVLLASTGLAKAANASVSTPPTSPTTFSMTDRATTDNASSTSVHPTTSRALCVPATNGTCDKPACSILFFAKDLTISSAIVSRPVTNIFYQQGHGVVNLGTSFAEHVIPTLTGSCCQSTFSSIGPLTLPTPLTYTGRFTADVERGDLTLPDAAAFLPSQFQSCTVMHKGWLPGQMPLPGNAPGAVGAVFQIETGTLPPDGSATMVTSQASAAPSVTAGSAGPYSTTPPAMPGSTQLSGPSLSVSEQSQTESSGDTPHSGPGNSQAAPEADGDEQANNPALGSGSSASPLSGSGTLPQAGTPGAESPTGGIQTTSPSSGAASLPPPQSSALAKVVSASQQLCQLLNLDCSSLLSASNPAPSSALASSQSSFPSPASGTTENIGETSQQEPGLTSGGNSIPSAIMSGISSEPSNVGKTVTGPQTSGEPKTFYLPLRKRFAVGISYTLGFGFLWLCSIF